MKNRQELLQRPSFASKTAFDALAVDDVEESEEEEEVEVVEPPEIPKPVEIEQIAEPSTNAQTQANKLSKTAQKKAAKAARQQQKELHDKTKTVSNGNTAKVTAPPGTVLNPVEISPEPETDIEQVVAREVPLSSPQTPDVSNGDASFSGNPVAHSTPPPVFTKPPPFPSSPMDVATRRASQSFAVGPLAKKDGDLQETHKNLVVPPTPLDEGWVKIQRDQEEREAEINKKKQNAITRTLWTLIMIGGFLLCLLLGHGFMIVLVMVCQTLVYREVTALFSLGVSKSEDDENKGKDPWSKTLNWYFFAVTNYFLYGESLIYYFKHVVFADAQLLPFATNHRFISFMLYMFGFVGFVASLQRQYLKSQFGLFCWVHMSLLVIVVSSHFIINNILEGLIWFWLPASLVICNDIFAYLWGITFGRTPLIKLSPKKTVEGFVGAFFSTVIFGLLWGTLFMRFDYMICPAHNLGVTALSSDSCVPNQVFVWREWGLPAPLRIAASTLLGRTVTTLPYATYQFHLLVMSCFASLVAPFGGFFASGFKRAFNIKDFGHSIPGHGGMTDRMDCQFLMGVFTYVYYSSLIREHHVTVGSVLQTIVSGLSLDEQLELFADLKRYLEGRGVAL